MFLWLTKTTWHLHIVIKLIGISRVGCDPVPLITGRDGRLSFRFSAFFLCLHHEFWTTNRVRLATIAKIERKWLFSYNTKRSSGGDGFFMATASDDLRAMNGRSSWISSNQLKVNYADLDICISDENEG